MVRHRRPGTNPFERVKKVMDASPVKDWSGRWPTIPSSVAPNLGAGSRLEQLVQPSEAAIKPGFWFTIAASNSPQEWKDQADFVCSGSNDQDVFDEASDLIFTLSPDGLTPDGFDPQSDIDSGVYSGYGIGIMLAPGTYMFDFHVRLYCNALVAAIPYTAEIVQTTQWTTNANYMIEIFGETQNIGWADTAVQEACVVDGIVFHGQGLGHLSSFGGGLTGHAAIMSFGDLLVTRCWFVGFQDGVDGYAYGRLTIQDSVFGSCRLGIDAYAEVNIIERCVFVSNLLSIGLGGGVMGTVRDCYFVDDGVDNMGYGWTPPTGGSYGIYADDQGFFTIENVGFINCEYGNEAIYVENHGHVSGVYASGVVGDLIRIVGTETVVEHVYGDVDGTVITFDGSFAAGRVQHVEIVATGDGVAALDGAIIDIQDVILYGGPGNRGVFVDAGSEVRIWPDVEFGGTWTTELDILGTRLDTGEAAYIFYDNTTSGLTADDVQAAIDELTAGGADKHYRHIQGSPSTTWTITHNLAKYPSIQLVDATGQVFIAQIDHIDDNNATVTLPAAQSGEAFCN